MQNETPNPSAIKKYIKHISFLAIVALLFVILFGVLYMNGKSIYENGI
jgi:hypothetical protein